MSGATDLPADELSGRIELRVGAYAIVHDERGVLLAHWQEVGAGGWTLPGGGMEPGEHPEATVVREVREETGYEVRVDALLGVGSIVIAAQNRISGSGRPLQALRVYYSCAVTGGVFAIEQDGSTDDVRWFSLDEIAQLDRVALVDEGLALAGIALPTPMIDPTWK